MSKIWMPGGGGSGASSDDCTLVKANVPRGMTAVTADSDDEAVEGTLNTETTLSDSQALAGQTYLKWNPQTKLFEKREGEMSNHGAWNSSVGMNSSVAIPAGYHNGGGKVNGPVITNQGFYNGYGNSHGNDSANQRMWVRIPGGYYNENANIYLSWADIRSMSGLTADKIRNGVTIMGMTGNFEGYTRNPNYLFDSTGWHNIQTTGFTRTILSGVDDSRFDMPMSGSKSYILDVRSTGNSTTHYPNISYRMNQTVDLSAYDFVKVKFWSGFSNNNNTVVGVSTNASATSYTVSGSSADRSGYAIVDVSGLTGAYYIFIQMSGSSVYGSNRWINDQFSLHEILLTTV